MTLLMKRWNKKLNLVRQRSYFVIYWFRVCVCVCVYTLPPAGFFRLHDVCDMREMFGSTIFCCEYYRGFCQVPSSPFPNLSSYFTSKDENSSPQLLERKRDIMLVAKNMIYIDIGYKSVLHIPTSGKKILKIRRLL